MRSRHPFLFGSLAGLLLIGSVLEAGPEDTVKLSIEAHLFKTTDGDSVKAELGRLIVPENRKRPNGRSVRLAFVRFPSTAGSPGAPIIYLAGGPGGSGIDAAKGPRLPLFLGLREVADVIALDQRGTGLSRPSLVCRESWRLAFDKPADWATMLEAAGRHSRSCATFLKKQGHDLTAYNANEIADDIEDLRRALGVERIRLWAFSYGTQLALTALQRHSKSIGQVILAGVVGPDQGLRTPEALDRRLEVFQRAIEADPATRERFPDFLDTMRGLLERLERQPVMVKAPLPLATKSVDLTVGKLDIQLLAAQSLGGAAAMARLPTMVQDLSEGNFSSVTRPLQLLRHGWLGSAMPYVVKCAQGVSEGRLELIRRQERNSLLGRAVDFPFPEICAAWGVTGQGIGLRSPARSEVPALFISGTFDARTPIDDAEEVRRGFPNSAHLIIENAGHFDDLFISSPEILREMLNFLRFGSISNQRIVLPLPRFPAGTE